MLGAKYGFAQFMDCAAQTMDPYFVGAIAHTYTCTCMSQLFIFIYIYIYIYFFFNYYYFFIIREHAWLAEIQLAIFILMLSIIMVLLYISATVL